MAATDRIAATGKGAAQACPRGPVWIYGPALDLLIGCGGWSAPLLMVAFLANRSNTQQWSVAFYFLALLFNYPHFMATVYRAYRTREQFEKYRIFTVHMALLLVVAGVLAHKLPALLPWLFTLYICWSPWHYTGQNFGLLMMFARRGELSPEPAERRALYAAFIASYVLLMLSFHTGPSNDDMVLSLNVPAQWAVWPKAACAVLFLVCGAWALWRFRQRAGAWAPLTAPITLFASQFLWFVLPVGLELTLGLEVPQTRYSSGILAVLHSTQYIWITSYYQRRESAAEGKTGWRFSAYFATLVAGGIALFIPGPWIVSRVFHTDFAASFLTFTALVNIHHFILDGAIWKLRDSRIAALLVGDRSGEKGAKAAEAAAESQPRAEGFFAVARWLAGASGGARLIRVAALLALVGWGLMDQLHFYWATSAGELPALERAQRLNPYDSGVLGLIARAKEQAKDLPGAVAAFTRAVDLRPQSRALQHSLAHALLSSGQYQQAYDLYDKLLARYPSDVDALVNQGLLAVRLGHAGEALDHWQRAVDLDPGQTNAQLYLADALSGRGEEQAAARHYRAYIDAVTAHPEQHEKENRLVIGALIKVADADARGHRPADAAIGYDAAAALAQKTQDPVMQSMALEHHAEFEVGEGNLQAAAAHFQRALSVDSASKDVPDAAADWAEYALFLHGSGQPEKYSYACFLKAEQLLGDSTGAEQRTVAKLRAASEVRMGRDAAAVRNNLEEVLKEAAALPPSAFAKR